jgi:hypothetical protein
MIRLFWACSRKSDNFLTKNGVDNINVCKYLNVYLWILERPTEFFFTKFCNPSLTLVLPYWLSSRLLIATPRALSMILRYRLLAFFLFYSDSWPVKMGPIRCAETSVNNYRTTPRNIPEERRSRSNDIFRPEVCLWWEMFNVFSAPSDIFQASCLTFKLGYSCFLPDHLNSIFTFYSKLSF